MHAEAGGREEISVIVLEVGLVTCTDLDETCENIMTCCTTNVLYFIPFYIIRRTVIDMYGLSSSILRLALYLTPTPKAIEKKDGEEGLQ